MSSANGGVTRGRESRMVGRESRADTREFWTGVARAFGGAVFFSLPLLMTMEMWWLGFYLDRTRLALFLLGTFPLLVGLSHYSGFRRTSSWLSDAIDAVVGLGIGFVASAVVLALFSLIEPWMPPREIIGKIALEAVPASFGAVLANSELSASGQNGESRERDRRKRETHYRGELFFMAAGAVFFAFNVAPTEEMVLIAIRMSAWHSILLVLASIGMMHAFVYAVDFRGQHRVPEGTPWWNYLLRFTVVGYAIALLVSAYVLWTFGRYEATAPATFISEAIVLGFPASLGAAAARLIL